MGKGYGQGQPGRWLAGMPRSALSCALAGCGPLTALWGLGFSLGDDGSRPQAVPVTVLGRRESQLSICVLSLRQRLAMVVVTLLWAGYSVGSTGGKTSCQLSFWKS